MQDETTHNTKLASKEKRIAAGAIDLLVIPLIIWFCLPFLHAGMFTPTEGRIFLMFVNSLLYGAWLVIRDTAFAPGRMMVGIRLVKKDGTAVGFGSAIVRNIHLMIPIIAIISFLVEFIAILATGKRISDRWVNTQVVEGKKPLNIGKMVSGGQGSSLDEIKKAKELLDAGAISASEFEKIKKAALEN